MRSVLLCLAGLMTFLGAFLLFQIQPMVAKRILPWFGGTPGVWSACMVFFQTALLAGYALAYALNRGCSLRTQAVIYALLLCAASVSLHVLPTDEWKPSASASPVGQILTLLISCVGLPYLLLSMLSPLLQIWIACALQISKPYFLYALSNFGSLAALISYPILVEPHVSLSAQARLWCAGFQFFTLCCSSLSAFLVCGSRQYRAPESEASGIDRRSKVSRSIQCYWFAFPCCSAALLLAITNHISHDVAVIPLLWILPLTTYLLSFIVVFADTRFYPRRTAIGLAALLLIGVASVSSTGPGASLLGAVTYSLGAFFIFCLVCHGELVLLQPPAALLTRFYLILSAGGAAGGMFVGLLAPLLFRSFAEFPLVLVCFIALVAVRLLHIAKDRNGSVLSRKALYGTAFSATLLACTVLVSGFSWSPATIARERNFFGVMTVNEFHPVPPADSYRELVHGLIAHGTQYLSAQRRREPTAYYTPRTAIGRLLTAASGPLRVGIIGLGAGAVAAYGAPGDVFRFYEINEHVIDLAQRYFTFLKDSSAKVELVLGDARLSMERESPQEYDYILLDAFSGDAVPVHLLTEEALDLYAKHLETGGVIVAHISNLHLNLVPVLEAYAAKHGWAFCYDFYQSEDKKGSFAQYAVRAPNSAAFVNLRCEPVPFGQKIAAPWTDDYSDLFTLLK